MVQIADYMNIATKIGSIVILFILISPFISFKKVGQIENKVEKIQKDLLEFSLTTLGDKLFSLIGDWDGKEKLKDRYDAFVQRAVNGNADKQQIESVAVDILNVTNNYRSIHPNVALDILNVADKDLLSNDYLECEPVCEKSAMSSSETASLGENLVRILKVNDNLKMSCSTKKPSQNFGEKITYEFDQGIVITLHEDIKSTLCEADHIMILKDLEEMEEVFQVEWKKAISSVQIVQTPESCRNVEKFKGLKLIHPGWEDFDVSKDFSVTVNTLNP